MATDAANVAETVVGPAAVAGIPVGVRPRWGLPLVADRAYDSDPLRAYFASRGFILIAPHRRGRKRPRTSDGRRLRRYKRRWIVERTFAWLHSYRRVVTRFKKKINLYDGFVHLACALIALGRLVK
ncbi:IS5/IS1182 family transposase [Limnoglobus roseus]|uniref:IS5/IS1182 family transposase n=1 Tax=Limnoglobus roseus TaxID=2598579 RepID=A0A5C1AEM4_9BACT|nr:IS5/IS1182 family transposase [Limnoglobus roseus]